MGLHILIVFMNRISHVDEFVKRLFHIYITVKKEGYREVSECSLGMVIGYIKCTSHAA